MSRITKPDRKRDASRLAGQIVMQTAGTNLDPIRIVDGVPYGIVSAVSEDAAEIREFALVLVAGTLAQAKLSQSTKVEHDSQVDELVERYMALAEVTSNPRDAWELSANGLLNSHLPHVKQIANAIIDGESLTTVEILEIVDGG